MNFKVSIIIPVFNAEKYVDETIKSVLFQSYNNIEVIVVDDGSTDKSIDIIREFNSNKIKIFSQENSGGCRARNLGFEKSTGDLILYLDADDLISEEYIEEKVNCFIENDLFIVVTSELRRFQNDIDKWKRLSERVSKDYSNGIDLIYEMAKFQQPFQVSAWMISRKLQEKSGNWNEKLLRNQDGELFIRILLNCSKVVYCKGICSYYRLTTNSLSNTITRQSFFSLIESIDLYKSNVLRKIDNKKIRKAIIRYYLSILLINKNRNPEIEYEIKQRLKTINHRSTLGGNIFVRFFSLIFGGVLTVKIVLIIKTILRK
jgi:glycosyltransferase involved in cell wall biosynthesis